MEKPHTRLQSLVDVIDGTSGILCDSNNSAMIYVCTVTTLWGKPNRLSIKQKFLSLESTLRSS
uniref:Uncharacterized protein n=1 Tax=Lepeophtheirus salmonis TaxID=72036 RepID=A0A0K2UMR9_LEPSM